MLVEQSTELPCSMEPVPKNAKLGIDGTEEVNSKLLEFPGVKKEKLAEAEQGVDKSSEKEENDALHVNAGDSTSERIGDPVPLPKLMSCCLIMNGVENEPLPVSHSGQPPKLFRLNTSESSMLSFIHE